MVIMGYAALAGLSLIWAMSRSPLARAIGTSVSQFADAYDHNTSGLS